MNRSICDVFGHILPAARNGELYHRYVLGVYDLLERFLERFPKILLEGCSGRGGDLSVSPAVGISRKDVPIQRTPRPGA